MSNDHLSLTFSELASGSHFSNYWYYQGQSAAYFEHFGVYSSTWYSTKESENHFSVNQPFSGEGNTRTAKVRTNTNDLEVTRTVSVPYGNSKYFTIYYKLENIGDSTLNDVRFFETVDFDIVDVAGDHGWYTSNIDQIWMIDSRYFKNGFGGSIPSNEHGIDYYSTELYDDWDDGNLNGADDSGEISDPAIGMQWNVGSLRPDSNWEITLTFNFGSSVILCDSDSDCGGQHWKNTDYCVYNYIYDRRVTPMCANPGTTFSYCYEEVRVEEKQRCEKNCRDGECLSYCIDGVRNEDEEGIDCGGSCPNQNCCNNGYQDEDLGEEGVDCGRDNCDFSCVVPVLLVHGYLIRDPLNVWEDMKARLEAESYVVYAIDLEERPAHLGFANGDIKYYAEILRDEIKRVKEETRAKQVDIVSHDFGGLVVRWYLQDSVNEKHIRKLVMIASLNHGSSVFLLTSPFYLINLFKEPIKRLLALKGIDSALADWSSLATFILGDASLQMIPYSPFLNKLNYGAWYRSNGEDIIAENVDYFNIAGNKTILNYYTDLSTGDRYLLDVLPVGEDDSLVAVKSVDLDNVYLSKFYFNHTELPHKESIFNEVRNILEGSIQPVSSLGAGTLDFSVQAQDLKQEQEIVSFSGTLYQDEEISHELVLDNLDYVSFILGHYPAKIAIEIIFPNGTIVTKNNCAELGYCFEDYFLEGFSFFEPLEGGWVVNITGLNVSEYGVGYTLQAFTKSNITLKMNISKYHYDLGSMVHTRARLREGYSPITGATVSARIVKPNGTEEVVYLYDPLIGGDNYYEHFYYGADQYGMYDVTVKAEGSFEGEGFEREIGFAFWVEGFPDLTVNFINFSELHKEEKYVIVSAGIENIEDFDAENATIELMLEDLWGELVLDSKTVDVDGYEEVIVYFNWTNVSTAETYNVSVQISQFNSFIELNYSNNRVSKEIDVCVPSWILNDTWSDCKIDDEQYRNWYDSNSCSKREVPSKEIRCWGSQGRNFSVENAVQLATKGSHSCILTSNGNVECWGNNIYGQSYSYLKGDAIQVSVGEGYTCVLKNNSNIDCWGRNDKGQSTDYNRNDAIQVSAGFMHTCALKSNGNVECWGENGDNQAIGYTNGDAIQLTTGYYHTCILTNKGNVDCWGNNGNGRANDYTLGDAINVTASELNTC
ncbi:MAG: hypothetical protein QF506_03860, partial [Candidatus Woesearchaeota archaeon]|nr:hypothetical protein [Candidatus Woesearchaeota archaeon]